MNCHVVRESAEDKIKYLLDSGAGVGIIMENKRKSHEVYKGVFVICDGSIHEGFAFYGPFDTSGEANKWAVTNLMSDCCTIESMFYVRGDND